ncbi:hypothetical protein IC582_019488 [Cucumis melo]
MISGARYSCVPTKDMDLTLVGSAMSSGRDPPTKRPKSDLDFRFFLEGRMRGRKLEGCIQPWTTNSSSSMPAPDGPALVVLLAVVEVVFTLTEEDLTRVGLTEQRRERSKSESMM